MQSVIVMKATVPLDSSFLKRWVPISCCSGELEKIIWVISSVITLPFTQKERESSQKQMIVMWFLAVKEEEHKCFSDFFSSHHEWVHVVCLGLQVATISHPIILWDTVILHCCNIPPLEKLQDQKATKIKALIHYKCTLKLTVNRCVKYFFRLFLPVHPFSVCEAVTLPLLFSFSFLLCSETCFCSSWAVHCP